MNKIIGFAIAQRHITDINIDFFGIGLNLHSIEYNGFSVYLWGIGEIESCKIEDKYSLSFPIHNSLLDRNILISLQGENIIVENDWLGSIPVFYSKRTKIVSTLCRFCLKDKTICNEGLSLFCEFGYSVFEQTIFKDVKFMRYFSILNISDDNIDIIYKDDPILNNDTFKHQVEEQDALKCVEKYINTAESKLNGDIILPLSGGYDSRLVGYFVKDKCKLRSFTYGISADQSQSSEVVYAKKLSELLDIKWEQVNLSSYHRYITEWANIHGFSTHLHGMYHIEFYAKILKQHKFNKASLLSGIFGDIWAGSTTYKNIDTHNKLINLGYTHGMNLDLTYLNFKSNNELKKKFYEEHTKYLENDLVKTVFTIRMKLILISYLTQLPEYFGAPAWTPFLNFDVAVSMLSIKKTRRTKRAWQKEFFKSIGLNVEDMKLKASKSNKLDYQIAKNFKFESIDIQIMKEYVDEKRLTDITDILNNESFISELKNELLYIPKIGGILRRLGSKNTYLDILYDYYVVKAIEMSLKNEH